MWYLRSDYDKRVIYIVPIDQKNSVIIGRSTDSEVCNFALAEDASISRTHAALSATSNGLILQDLGSRYGTFVNDFTNKVDINTNIMLNDNDVVKFGKMQSIWKVNRANLVTCTSTLKGENLQNLRINLSKLGGELRNEWDDSCSYLTMPAITLTIKVVLALVQGSHIVTTDFWNKCVESIQTLSSLPDPSLYIPQIVESTLNKDAVSFEPDLQRKSLFQGKKFVFFSRRQFDMYKPVLIKSSASPLLLSECRMTISMLCANDVVVIQYIPSGASQESLSQKNQITDIVNSLKNKGKRVIADAEIGLAILYCNTTKYCNTDFSFTSEVVKQTSTLNEKPSRVLAQESQDTAPQQRTDNLHINESLASVDGSFGGDRLSSKRKIDDVKDVLINPNKKLATSTLLANIPSDGTKRKLSEDNDTNPAKKTAFENANGNTDIGNNNAEGMFNFIDAPANNESQNKSKKLNLSRPQKRRLDQNGGIDGLFNFVPNDGDKDSIEALSKQSMFSTNKSIEIEDDSDQRPERIKANILTVEEITAMRGAKLKELMEKNTSNSIPYMKKEKMEDLHEEMSNLNLGNTVVVTCNDLIIKRESQVDNTSAVQSLNTSTKNFKKFKKVWPLAKQNTVYSMPITV